MKNLELNIESLKKAAWDIYCEKGFNDLPRTDLEVCAGMLSELGEATEEVRKGTPFIYQIENNSIVTEDFNAKGKPEGEAIELADYVIWLMNFFTLKGVEMNFNDPSSVNIFHFQAFSKKSMEFHTLINWMTSESFIVNYPAVNFDTLSLCVHFVNEYFKSRGWNLAQAVKMKMDYNSLREKLHGKKG